VKSIEWFLQRIKTDTKAEDVAKFRQYIARFGDTGRYEDNVPVAIIHPLVEMVKTENGNLEITTFNSLTWLHVGNLMKSDDVNAVKEASKILPTTYAAFTGADGRSVEILVSVAQKDTSARPMTEGEMDAFCEIAYEVAFGAYSGVLPKPIERQTVKARSSFRMTLDEAPYYNSQATPMMVQTLRETTKPADNPENEQREMDYRLYEDYELIYKQAAHEAFEETLDINESERYDAYITLLAHKLCEMNVSEEEAFVHIRNHHVYKKIYDESRVRAIVSTAYSEENPKRRKEGEMVSVETRRLIDFLKTKYVFRYNEVMGYTEYRPNNTWMQD
jgi:hypothetical protein